MNSIWTNHVDMPQFQSLPEDARTEVLIIGGGMAGILCALFLQRHGVDYMLVEGKTIGNGVTQNTTAKITAQHRLIYDRLLQDAGREKARQYLQANLAAVEEYARLCQDIDCDFQRRTSLVYSLNDCERLEKEQRALGELGVSSQLVDTAELPFSSAGALALPEQAQFHPLKFLAGAAKGLSVFEHTYVKKLLPHTAITDRGKIDFQKVIVATHFPIDNKHGMYFLKMYQQRSYVLALEGAWAEEGEMPIHGMYVDEAEHGMSFRSYGNLLLLGGGGHRTGKQGGNWQELRNFAARYYPSAREVCCWATQDCMTLDGVPYIGRYSASTPNHFVATGFGKWGMTSSMVSAMILTELVRNGHSPWEAVFDPSRSMMKKQLLCNGLESTKTFLTPSLRRCPHLGCTLKWNAAEHSWDCPCHGSRFGENGELLNNPAMHGLSWQVGQDRVGERGDEKE